MTRLFVDWAQLPGFVSATSIAVTAGERRHRFALIGTGKAMAALETCQDDLVRSWGFDPEATRALAQQVKAIEPQRWVTDLDYPGEARRLRQEGAVRFLLPVNAEGRPVKCVVIQSSGTSLLDTRACELVMKRARFVAARDEAGNRAPSFFASAIRWVLP